MENEKEAGIFVGVTLQNEVPIIFNPSIKRYDDKINMLVLGRAGHGKSFKVSKIDTSNNK